MRKLTLPLALVVSWAVTASPMAAWANAGGLDPKLDYRITYQTGSNSGQTVGPARITDVVEIGSRRFLEVYIGGYATPGYIDLDSVRSILPSVR